MLQEGRGRPGKRGVKKKKERKKEKLPNYQNGDEGNVQCASCFKTKNQRMDQVLCYAIATCCLIILITRALDAEVGIVIEKSKNNAWNEGERIRGREKGRRR